MRAFPGLRWTQFGLRALLGGMALSALFFSWLNQLKQHQRAIDTVRAAGGHVRFAHEYGSAGEKVPPGPKWIRAICGQECLAEVRELALSGRNGEPWKCVPRFSSLELVTSGRMSETAMDCVVQTPSIRRLQLAGKNINPRVMEKLKFMKNLESLELLLFDGWVDRETVESLAQCGKLADLAIAGSVTDGAFGEFHRIPSLRVLGIQSAQFREESVLKLKQMSNLRQLILYGGDGMSNKLVDELSESIPDCEIDWR